MSCFGLIGYPLSHSLSQKLFQQQFGDTHQYNLLAYETKEHVMDLLKHSDKYAGFNVTIPYKEFVINLLDSLSSEAGDIRAVNTIFIERSGKKVGHNTDAEAFRRTLVAWLPQLPASAIILGGGGASKAVAYALEALNIPYSVAVRSPKNPNDISYQLLKQIGLGDFELIINTTPCGTFPNVLETPPISTDQIGDHHKIYDLVYNPSTTALLKVALRKGATAINGINMLELQAKLSWKIWGLI